MQRGQMLHKQYVCVSAKLYFSKRQPLFNLQHTHILQALHLCLACPLYIWQLTPVA